MPRGRFPAKQLVWQSKASAHQTKPPFSAPVAPLPAPVLQEISPNKRKFNTAQDAEAKASWPSTKRSRPGPSPGNQFGVDRKVVAPKPRQRRHHSYTREEKLKVIDYIANRSSWVHEFRPHTRTPEGLLRIQSWRPPTYAEVARTFCLSPSLVSDWWRQRLEILQSSTGSRRCTTNRVRSFWPALEERLYTVFIQRRGAGNLVSRGWFRRCSKALFQELYATDLEFTFSNR